MDNNEHGTNLVEVGTDCISRQAAIDAVRMVIGDNRSISVCDAIKKLPPAEPSEECERCMMEHMDEMERLETELAFAKIKRER